MRIPPSDWPKITDPADVDPAWEQLRRLTDQYAALIPVWDETKFPHRSRFLDRLDLLPSRGPEHLYFVAVLAGIPSDVSAVTKSVGPSDFDYDVPTPVVGAARCAAAYWSNRHGLEQLHAGRGRTKTVSRSSVRDLDRHLTGTLVPHLGSAFGHAGHYFDQIVHGIETALAAAENGYWHTSGELLPNRHDVGDSEPRTPVAAQLRTP